MTSKRLTAAAVGIATLSLLTPAAASARSVEHDHEAFTESFLLPADFCGDAVTFPVQETNTWKIVFSSVQRGDGFVYGHDHIRLLSIDTNVLNGKSLTFVQTNNGSAQSTTDNGDGTLSVVFKNRGMVRVYAPDGSLIGMRAGMGMGTAVFDDNGTPSDQSDDEFLSFTQQRMPHHNTLAGLLDCEDINAYLS